MVEASSLFGGNIKTEIRFTAGEAIAARDTVDLNANGEIFKRGKAQRAFTLRDESVIAPSFQNQGAMVFVPASNKLVATYRDASDQIVTIIGTVNTTSGDVAWSAESISAEVASSGIREILNYTTAADTVVLTYKTSTSNLKAMVIDVSGATAAYGTAITVETDNENTTGFQDKSVQMLEDTTNDKVVITTVNDTSSFELRSYVGTITGTSISLGVKQVAETTTGSSGIRIGQTIYSSTQDSFVISFSENTSGSTERIAVIAGQVSGTNINFGSASQLTSSSGNLAGEPAGLFYDSVVDKYIAQYTNGQLNDTFIKAFDVSTTTIVQGTEINIETNLHFNSRIVKDSVNNLYYAYTSTTSGGADERVYSLSGNDLSLLDDFNPLWTQSDNGGTDIAFESTDGKIIALESNNKEINVIDLAKSKSAPIVNKLDFSGQIGNSNISSIDLEDGRFFSLGNSLGIVHGTESYWVFKFKSGFIQSKPLPLGVAREAIAADAAGRVFLTQGKQGSEITATGLTPGMNYFADGSGDLTEGGSKDDYVGYAISTTKLIANNKENFLL